jgi:uncharacterized protein YoxC
MTPPDPTHRASKPAPEAGSAANPIRPKLIRQMGQMAVGTLIGSVLLLFGGVLAHWDSERQRHSQLVQLELVQGRLQQELIALNTPSTSPARADALKALLALGQQVSQQADKVDWFGSLHQQNLQVLLTQALETLSRPIAVVNASEGVQQQLETQVRLDTLPKLARLKAHVEQATNGLLVLIFGLAGLLAVVSAVMGLQWFHHRNTLAMKQRINMLGRALQTQENNQHQREGAQAALQGVLNALNQNQQLEHRGTLLQIAQQLEELNQSGRAVLEFARSFHQLSAQGTQVAKSALTNEQRNQKASSHMESMQAQLDGLRADIRSAAQGLRKAGEVSRQLLGRLDASQLELSLSENENPTEDLQDLVAQSQQALKESIEGLVLASQKINMSHHESNKLAQYMAVNQTAWSNLLSQVESVAESAAGESQKAIRLAKHLINKTSGASSTNNIGNQAASAPPQLLP